VGIESVRIDPHLNLEEDHVVRPAVVVADDGKAPCQSTVAGRVVQCAQKRSGGSDLLIRPGTESCRDVTGQVAEDIRGALASQVAGCSVEALTLQQNEEVSDEA
jgi:hypothetical protein